MVLPRIIIVGGGFAGPAAAKGLAGAACEILLIDRRNHHLFQPLLYQVTKAALAPNAISQPIRHILRSAPNVTAHWNEVTGIGRRTRGVSTLSGHRFAYDYLVLATGATQSYFARDDWAEVAPGLKSIEDAFELRARILGAFERAEMEPAGPRRDALLEFVVVGAGPTGVEMPGAIAELSRHSLTRDFRSVSAQCARIKLVEAGLRILPAFHPRLSDRARRALERMGVEVLTDTRVTDMAPGMVALNGSTIAAETVIWAAGVQASPPARWLGVETDRGGRAPVNATLRLADDPRVLVVGDMAAYTPDATERPLPGVAPVAEQMGAHAAKVIRAELDGRRPPKPFRYRDWGTMATIGRNRAVVPLGRLRAAGFFAWILCSAAHVSFLTGGLNRLVAAMSWAWSCLTWHRGARVILAAVTPMPRRDVLPSDWEKAARQVSNRHSGCEAYLAAGRGRNRGVPE